MDVDEDGEDDEDNKDDEGMDEEGDEDEDDEGMDEGGDEDEDDEDKSDSSGEDEPKAAGEGIADAIRTYLPYWESGAWDLTEKRKSPLKTFKWDPELGKLARKYRTVVLLHEVRDCRVLNEYV
jgi:hypothetical protein